MNIQWILYHPVRLTALSTSMTTTTSATTTSTVKNLIIEQKNIAEQYETIKNDTQTLAELNSVQLNISQSFNADDRMNFSAINFHRNFDLTPLLPFGMMLIICTIIFILIIFRRWPGLVAGIIAGCLTSISIYLLFLAIKDQKLVYE